jgi:hypothetical protein
VRQASRLSRLRDDAIGASACVIKQRPLGCARLGPGGIDP